MRISKIIVALLVSVVAVTAMTGVAVASPENVIVRHASYPITPVIPFDSSYTTYTINITDIENAGNHSIYGDVYDAGSGNIGDLRFNFCTVDDASNNRLAGTTTNGYTSDCSGWVSQGSGNAWDWGSTQGNYAYQRLRVDVKAMAGAPENNLYRFNVSDNGASESGHGSTSGVSVPEFATIAIPAIAVLGLFLFFNKRKHKKD